MDRLTMAKQWAATPEGKAFIAANRPQEAPKPEPTYADWLRAGINANQQNPEFQQDLIMKLLEYNDPRRKAEEEAAKKQEALDLGGYYITMGSETGDEEMMNYGKQLLQEVGGYGSTSMGGSGSDPIQSSVNDALLSQFSTAKEATTGDELRFNTAMEDYLTSGGTMERGYSANYDKDTGAIYKQPEVSGAYGDLKALKRSGPEGRQQFDDIMGNYKDSLSGWDKASAWLNPFGDYKRALEYSQRVGLGNLSGYEQP